MSDIERMIESLSAKEIEILMARLSNNNRHSVDTSYRARRNKKTELYFKCAPLPYKTDYETYLAHSDAIREQVLSGVDL